VLALARAGCATASNPRIPDLDSSQAAALRRRTTGNISGRADAGSWSAANGVPGYHRVESTGLEPVTPCLQSGGAGIVERHSRLAANRRIRNRQVARLLLHFAAAGLLRTLRPERRTGRRGHPQLATVAPSYVVIPIITTLTMGFLEPRQRSATQLKRPVKDSTTNHRWPYMPSLGIFVARGGSCLSLVHQRSE
jgi:hypothetical protein